MPDVMLLLLSLVVPIGCVFLGILIGSASGENRGWQEGRRAMGEGVLTKIQESIEVENRDPRDFHASIGPGFSVGSQWLRNWVRMYVQAELDDDELS